MLIEFYGKDSKRVVEVEDSGGIIINPTDIVLTVVYNTDTFVTNYNTGGIYLNNVEFDDGTVESIIVNFEQCWHLENLNNLFVMFFRSYYSNYSKSINMQGYTPVVTAVPFINGVNLRMVGIKNHLFLSNF